MLCNSLTEVSRLVVGSFRLGLGVAARGDENGVLPAGWELYTSSVPSPAPRPHGYRPRIGEPVSQIAWLNYFLSPWERIEVRAPRRTTVIVVSIEDSYDFTLHPNPLPQNGRGDY